MIKKILTLMAVFCVSFLVARYFIGQKHALSRRFTKVTRLAECIKADFRELEITRMQVGERELLRFSRSTSGNWRFSTPDLGEADSDIIDHLSEISCETYDPVEATPQFDEKFATLEWKNASEKSIVKFMVSASAIAVDSGRDKKTFSLTPVLFRLLSLPREAYQNKRVVSLQPTSLRSVKVLLSHKEVYRFQYDADGWHTLIGKKDLGASITAKQYVNRIATLRAIKLLQLGLTKSECEQRANAIVIELEDTEGAREEIRFGAPSDFIVACSDRRNTLFGVHPDMWKYLREPANHFREKNLPAHH